MSNLVEIAKDLEYVPDEQLIQLANGSDPRFPPFVVISEIKRRTDMRNRASEPMPKTTVAQEMVQEFAMPSRQGLEGMSQDATGILPPTVYNRDMPSSNMADGGLVGYATGDETKYRGKINQLVGAKLGPTNPKTLDESMSRLERYRKSQQIGRLINNPDNPLNKFFRYIPDGQQISNYLQGRRGEDFTPDVRRPTDKPNNKKQEGGLTSYQTGNQTALTNTFIYGDNYANNLEDYLDMKRRTSTMDQREQSYLGQNDLKFPMLSTTPDFSMDMSGISALTPTQTDLDSAVVTSLPFMPFGEPERPANEGSIAYQQKKVDEARENLNRQRKIGDRGSLGGGTSYIERAENLLNTQEKRLAALLNRRDLNVQIAEAREKVDEPVKQQIAEFSNLIDGKIKIETDDGSKDGTTDTSKSKKFADMDLNIPERTQKPRTEAQMKQQLNADVLMTVGTAIGSSTTPAEIFQKLSGLPAQLAASRKEQRKEVRDFESDRRADALQKLNIQIALKKIDQAQEQAKLKGDANDIAAINAIADVLTNINDTTSPRYKAAESALDSIIAKLTGSNAQGIAALEKQFENIATLGG
tara:strand:+ start:10099 stop:11850 length:1752 start_codon:yes stop_codon:yes gene_type:complete